MIDKAQSAKHVSNISLNKICTKTIRKQHVPTKWEACGVSEYRWVLSRHLQLSVSKSDFMISHMMLATDWEWNNIGLDQSGDTCSGWNNISPSSSDWIILQFESIKVSLRVGHCDSIVAQDQFGKRPFPAPPLTHWIKQLIKPIRQNSQHQTGL